jgi:hypothetical protein
MSRNDFLVWWGDELRAVDMCGSPEEVYATFGVLPGGDIMYLTHDGMPYSRAQAPWVISTHGDYSAGGFDEDLSDDDDVDSGCFPGTNSEGRTFSSSSAGSFSPMHADEPLVSGITNQTFSLHQLAFRYVPVEDVYRAHVPQEYSSQPKDMASNMRRKFHNVKEFFIKARSDYVEIPQPVFSRLSSGSAALFKFHRDDQAYHCIKGARFGSGLGQ